jgi:D-alanyl-D-alanine carboxypeptidase
MTRSVSPRFWLARIRPVVVAVTATAMVALAACSSTVPSTSGGSATSSAQASTPLTGAVATQLDAAIGQAMTTASIPGAIVGIWGPAGNYVRTFGVADKVSRAPISTDMYSRIGSVTKTFTVTALLQLVDQGKLALDDPISNYMSGVPSGDQITLRELAQMRSGLITFDDVTQFSDPYIADPHKSFTPAQLLGYALDKPLQFPPGTQYQYSNTNTVLLGLVVEKQSGQTLPDYISEHILGPLKMSHTSFPTTPAFPEPHPQGYTTLHGAEQISTDWNFSWAWAAGNMISTLDDMRIWARALATGALLKPETQRQRLDTTVPMNPEQTSFYGLGIINAAGWSGHTGVIFGYETMAFYLPQTQTTLVFFINTDVPQEASATLAHAITSVICPDHVIR